MKLAHSEQLGNIAPVPELVPAELVPELVSSVILAILFVCILAGARGFALSAGLTAVTTTLVVAFLAAMQVSESWI
jgi:hypothetical protein